MLRRLYLAYPALLAVIPILYRQAQNPGRAPTGDAVVFSLAVAVLIALVQVVCYAGIRLAMRRSPSGAGDWAALMAAVAVAMFYYWPATSDWAHAAASEHRQAARALAALAAAVLLTLLWWGTRRGGARRLTRTLEPVGRFLALVAVLLSGWSAAQLAVGPFRLANILRTSAVVRDLARPVPSTGRAAAGPRHDLYVFLLDSYPGADALRDVYGIDNTPFLDSLRVLGFRVPSRMRSNYPVTLFSVSSLLNFAHLQSLADQVPPGYKDYALGTYLLDHNRAARFLKALGYRFAYYPSSWYGPTRHNSQADYELPRPGGFDLAGWVYRSPLVNSFAEETLLRRPLHYFSTRQAVYVADFKSTFAGVTALGRRPAGGPPIFALAHVLVPHGPFYADSACRAYSRDSDIRIDAPPESSAVRIALAGYITCVNRQVLTTVRALLARPGPRPIILLQGDHGMQGLDIFAPPVDSITPAQVRERFSPLGAYYLPDGGAAAMPDTLSIVNVLRTVFSYYYGADLPRLPNAMYYLHPDRPYRIRQVDTLSLRPLPRAAVR